ncbi:TIR domain-containing protein [Spiroplasma endosymbiont of Dasysyrphus albostriatus]|uniref:TIR domain-containing protein n=1 Tax=Spiroplasma endosymbiont of Dasysyrphus albostriatus TaxID=3066299 RepID=UPI0030D1774A
MLKIFISYHHLREQKAKDELSELISQCYGEYFEVKDVSVKLGDIDPQLPPKKIFKTIREEYLKDSDITVVILGKHTKCRKHIDWEIASSLSIYGSLHRRGKNGLLILLTDDFIKKAKKNCDFNDNDYKTLINEQNSTPRIYENVINNYAIVESFSNVVSNPLKLKKLLDKCQDKVKTEKLKENFDLFKEINLFEENIEDCPKKSKNKLNCYFSQKHKSKKLFFEKVKTEVNNNEHYFEKLFSCENLLKDFQYYY